MAVRGGAVSLRDAGEVMRRGISLGEIVAINERMWWVTLLSWQEGSCRYTVDAGKPGLGSGDPATGRAGRKGGQTVV